MSVDIGRYGFADFVFSSLGSPPGSMGWEEFLANGQYMAPHRIELEGYLDARIDKTFHIVHRFGDRILLDTPVSTSHGAFKVELSLLRGANTVEIYEYMDRDRELLFSFDIFHRTWFRDWVETFMKAFIFVHMVSCFVVQAFYIPSGSMENTLFPFDYILVEKVSYMLGQPRRGDIVVFQYPLYPAHQFIKRLVGRAGDVLMMKDKVLYRNGKPVDEPYAVHKDFRYYYFGPKSLRDNWGPLKIPRRCVFMMGDNRDRSHDSRFWGPLPLWRIKGKAFAIYYPLSRIGLIRHWGNEAEEDAKADGRAGTPRRRSP